MALVANLVIDAGSDFQTTIFVRDSNDRIPNLGNYDVRGQLRKTYGSNTFWDFNAFVVNAEKGSISINLVAETTATLKPGRYVYDVEIIDNDTDLVTRVVEGQIEVTPRVTRPSN